MHAAHMGELKIKNNQINNKFKQNHKHINCDYSEIQ